MNIQIFGTKKCNDTKKAERFFKDRGIKYQFIDMKLYDDYKDGRIDRELYKQRAEQIGEPMEEIRQKMEELTRKPVTQKMLRAI
jgi:arsenate reductase-like glutaredoxin family protein